MSKDTRLARMAHVLVHMAGHDKAATSDVIARMLDTNPAAVRRTMASMRDAGYLTSEKGRGGGWRLMRSLDQITLLDIHLALQPASIFSVAATQDHAGCPVEQSANRAVLDALNVSQKAFEDALSNVRLDQVLARCKLASAAKK